MGYIPYYLVFALAGYALRYPSLLVAAVAVYFGRRWLPDPYLYLKHLSRVRALKSEIAGNPDNATARRDLAKIWLEKRRPRRATPLLEEARRRDPESVELRFLLGKSLLQSGQFEASLARLIEAADQNGRMHYGEAYLLAGRALEGLGRHADAEDAFSRFIAINSSSVEGRVRLARARREQRDRPGAAAALQDAVATFGQIPRFRRRAELAWYLRARLMAVGLV